MEKVVKKFKSFEESDQADKEYYLRLTPQERLQILFELNLRQQGTSHDKPADRLARVYRIIELQ